jgi:STE24 endopeptidase
MNYNYFVDISNVFFLLFLIGTTLSTIIDSTLEWMNSNKGNIGSKLKELYKIHPLMKKYFSRSKINKAQEYHSETNTFSDFHEVIGGNIGNILLLCGIFPFLLHSIINLLPSYSTTVHYIIFCTLITLGKTLFQIPFALYGTFHLEEKYGFNKTTMKTFIGDNIKGFLISVVFSIVGISIVNYVLTKFGPFSSYKICAFVGGLILVGMFMEFLYMTVLIRIFNKLTPLKNKNLVKRIKKLMESYGYNANTVYVMDASKRTNKANACIGGIGKSKKIILFDTLLKNYTNDELIAILGHELAHGKLHHLVYGRIISTTISLITTFIIFSMAYNVNLYHAFGFNFVNETNVIQYSLIGFILAKIVVDSIKWIISPFVSLYSRTCEYAADRYSVYYTKKKMPMITSLMKLTSENLGDVFPNKYYEMWNYSHPSIVNRINAIKDINLKKKD